MWDVTSEALAPEWACTNDPRLRTYLASLPRKSPACVASRRKLTGEWKWDPNFPNDEEEDL